MAGSDEKRTDASPRSREAWIRMATARARSGTAAWAFMRTRDRISDDLLLQAQAVFQGGDRLSVEIAFECNIDAGKRLKASVRAFDARTKASLRIPPDDSHANVVRGGVTLDEGAPQTAFLFPERDERQATRRRVAGGAGLTCSRDGVPSASIFSDGESRLSTGNIGGEAGGRRL